MLLSLTSQQMPAPMSALCNRLVAALFLVPATHCYTCEAVLWELPGGPVSSHGIFPKEYKPANQRPQAGSETQKLKIKGFPLCLCPPPLLVQMSPFRVLHKRIQLEITHWSDMHDAFFFPIKSLFLFFIFCPSCFSHGFIWRSP